MRILSILIIIFFVFSCKTTTETSPIDFSKYPKALQEIFKTHGGLAQWKQMQSLSYTTVDPEKESKTWINLHNRHEKIQGSNYTMGFDGQEYWLEAGADYTGNPKFMTNLMFYFYAMPFVLADDGIIYSETADLIFEGKSYPGIRISYKSGVGVSSEDEYFIHYDPETKQMAWLGYTVTYFSQKKSEKVRWIRYDDWEESNKVLLPSLITWYKLEEGQPTIPRNGVQFKEVKLSTKPFEESTFEKTSGAKVVE